ncbi:type II toxin-antitoxin system RatA family toxin [Taylorella equigenitalis]|uniref:Oligoketide cyclase/lipid transport protein n=1 Tax=Taylorella equigenitalis (strain MCE9) TaxID=937774 RepID=A0A654KK99_TAYEM|nr:type II toxin-antitoxin system RatA family toxin [Taylorella equigenitalis]ADU92336.1 Putative oligoketide cyclase/lipid transport protein [Taylorella equigenitalis MCE9]WDU55631.1 type II toxin-antitoxin system RatA family toxin [Taylorella equigenitalis]
MPVIKKSVLVPYSASQMFELVDNVKEYPEFMPWCGGATEIQRTDSTLIATVVISIAGLKQSFTTTNLNTPPTKISLTLVEGPFSALSGEWNFKPLAENACKVSFDLKYDFKSKPLALIVGPVFNTIASTFIDSFTKRAQAKYGEASL